MLGGTLKITFQGAVANDTHHNNILGRSAKEMATYRCKAEIWISLEMKWQQTPIYLHLDFAIVQFEISSLMSWILFLV